MPSVAVLPFSWSFWWQLIKATFKVASYWLVTSGWSEGVLWNLLCLFNLFLSVHQIPRGISASERRCVRKQKTWNVEMEVTAWVVHFALKNSMSCKLIDLHYESTAGLKTALVAVICLGIYKHLQIYKSGACTCWTQLATVTATLSTYSHVAK